MYATLISTHPGSPADFTQLLDLKKLSLCRTLAEVIPQALKEVLYHQGNPLLTPSFLEAATAAPEEGKKILTKWKVSSLQELSEVTDKTEQILIVLKVGSFVLTFFFRPGRAFVLSDRFFLVCEYTSTALFTAKLLTYLAADNKSKSLPKLSEKKLSKEQEAEQMQKQLLATAGGMAFSLISQRITLLLFGKIFNHTARMSQDQSPSDQLINYSFYCSNRVIRHWKIKNLQELADQCHGIPFYFARLSISIPRMLLVSLGHNLIPETYCPALSTANIGIEHGMRLLKLGAYLIQR